MAAEDYHDMSQLGDGEYWLQFDDGGDVPNIGRSIRPEREQKRRRGNWRQPEKQYNVVRKHEKSDGSVLWFPVGTISFWEDGSAKLNMHAFPQSFHVFPRED